MDEHPEQQTEENLRKCAICNRGIPERPYQAQSVRTCSPGCAKLLAVREHPDIGDAHQERDPDDGRPRRPA